MGVGRGEAGRDLADHVLSRPEAVEQAEIDAAVDRAADAVVRFLEEGIEPVMNRFNRADDNTQAD